MSQEIKYQITLKEVLECVCGKCKVRVRKLIAEKIAQQISE